MSVATTEITTHRQQAEAFSELFLPADRTAVLHGYLRGVEVAKIYPSDADILDILREARERDTDNPVTAALVNDESFIVGAAFGAMAERKESV